MAGQMELVIAVVQAAAAEQIAVRLEAEQQIKGLMEELVKIKEL
jgi:hypothetical protein